MTGSGPDNCVLALDLSTKRLRGIVVDDNLDVVYAEEVAFDAELPAYGTINGVHSRMASSTWPCHMHIRALDLLFAKIASSFDLSRVRLVTGCAPQHSSVWWSKTATSLLSRLQPSRPLSDQLLSHQTWTLPDPPTPADVTAAHCTQPFQWYSSSSPSAEGAEQLDPPSSFAEKTGSRAVARMLACQVIKVLQSKKNVYAATDRISVGGGLFASVLVGSIVPMTEGEAATTGLWNVGERDWDQSMLAAVVSPGNAPASSDIYALLRKLGTPTPDPCRPIGQVSSYFVKRYNFDPTCSVLPFSTTQEATALSTLFEDGDVLVSLGKDGSDVVVAPVLGEKGWVTDPAWQTVKHPARRGGEGGSERGFVVMEYRDAAVARESVRDTYCSGSWHIFDTLVSLICEGGKIGLDDKLFAFFWPHGETGVWQGISRFDAGQRVDEFQDRRVNPRAIVESQFLTMRMHLSRLHHLTHPSKLPVANDPIGFSPHDPRALPKRLIVYGGTTEDRVLVDLLASVLGARVFHPACLAAGTYAPYFRGKEGAISTAAIGAAHKGLYARHLSTLGTTTRRGGGEDSFEGWLRRALRERKSRNWRTMLEGKRPSVPILTASMASFEAPEATPERKPTGATVTATVGVERTGGGVGPGRNTPVPVVTVNGNRRMSFSTMKLAETVNPGSGSGGGGQTSGLTTGGGSGGGGGGGVLVVPIHTHPDDAEAGLIQVAEPDRDLCERYGGIVEEFARLDRFVSRGLL